MRKFTKTECRREAEMLKALAHPTRLAIVRRLADGEHCVCEFVAAAGASFSTVSQHLTVLRNAGIVVATKRGQSVYYRLSCPCVTSMLDCLAKRK